MRKFIQQILPAIQTWAQNNGTDLDMCAQELERILKKLVTDRRAVASSVKADEQRVDQIREKRESTKYDFQIEQLTKVKDTEGKHLESYTNFERPNTK